MIRISTIVLFALALTVAFFMRGLYFDEDYYIFAIIFSALFLLYLFTSKGETRGINSLMDWFLIGAFVLYVIFSFFALSMRDTLLTASKYGIYLMAFLMGKNLLIHYKKTYLNIIYVCGILLMLTGLSSALGGPFVFQNTYLVEKGLLLSPLQYHNVFASLSIVLLLIGISLYVNAEKLRYRCLYVIGNFALFLGILMSNSRGNWLIFPIVFIVYLIFSGKGQIKNILTVAVSIFVAVFAMLGLIDSAIQNSNPLLGWTYFLLGCIIAIALYFMFAKTTLKIEKKAVVIFIVLLLLLAGMIGIFYEVILPSNMVTRIKELNLNAQTLSERLTFYKDGFTIFKEYPMGTGGNGWIYTYKEFQSYNYASNHPHSYFVLLMVELGILGIALFLLLIFGFVQLCMKGVRRTDNRIVFVGLSCGVLTFLLHVMFDFETSYTAYMIFMFSLLGMMASDLPSAKKLNHNKIVLIVITTAILIWNTTLYFGYSNYVKAINLSDANIDRAIKVSQDAVKLDPLNAEYQSNSGMLLLRTTDSNKTTKAKTAEKYIQAGYGLNNRNVTALTNYISYTTFSGNPQLALKLVEKYILMQPLEPYAYFQKANLYTQIGMIYQEQNDIENLKRALQDIIYIETQFAINTQKSSQKEELNQETIVLIDQAKKVLGQVYTLSDENATE